MHNVYNTHELYINAYTIYKYEERQQLWKMLIIGEGNTKILCITFATLS